MRKRITAPAQSMMMVSRSTWNTCCTEPSFTPAWAPAACAHGLMVVLTSSPCTVHSVQSTHS